MDSKTLKWLAAIAVIAFLAFTGNVQLAVGGTDAQTGQPTTVEVPAASAGEQQVDQVVDGVLGTVPQLIAASAIGGFVALLLNLGKLFPNAGKVLDGKTGTITTVVNVIAFIIINVAGLFGYGDRVKSIIEQTGNTIPAVLGLITIVGGALSAFGGSSLVHELMKKINPNAFSFSFKKIEAAVTELFVGEASAFGGPIEIQGATPPGG